MILTCSCSISVDDDMANVIVAQLLYLDAIDPTKDVFMTERRKAKMLNFSIAHGKTDGFDRDWKVAFYVFSSSLVFSSLAKSVTLHDLISWWFIPVNIGIFFLIGGPLGWIVVKILRPGHHLECLVIGSCLVVRQLVHSTMHVILVGSPMYQCIWRLMRKSGALYDKMCEEEKSQEMSEVTIKIEGDGNFNGHETLVQQSLKSTVSAAGDENDD